MVAVACAQCGEFHRSAYDARPAGAGSSSCGERGTVWEATAELADVPITTHPGSGVVPVSARPPDVLHPSARPRLRTSTVYTNGSYTNGSYTNGSYKSTVYTNGDGLRGPAPKALAAGRRPPPPAPPPRVPRERPRDTRTEPLRPRRPLVQVIQDVLNRSVARDLEPGASVVVRNQFNGRWTPGFDVHEVLDDGYRVRRHHTGAVLPTIFVRRDVAADGTGRDASSGWPDRTAACVSV
jgi:hypothetical protein